MAQGTAKWVSQAILLGMAAVILDAFVLSSLVGNGSSFVEVLLGAAVVYTIAGLIFGMLSHRGGFVPGLLIAAPNIVFVLASILFTWIFNKFLSRDLPLIVVTIVTPIIGSLLGAWIASHGNFKSLHFK